MNEKMTMAAEVTRSAFDRYVRRGMVTSGLTNEVNPIAGYLMPEEIETKLINAMNDIGVIRSLCTEMKTDRDRIVPIITGHGKPEWIPEGTAAPLVKDILEFIHDNHKSDTAEK